MEQDKTQMELTIEELIALINAKKGDFMVKVELGEEADENAEEESVQA